MKKFLSIIAAVVLALGVTAGVSNGVQASDYTVSLTTYVPTGSGAEYTSGSYPNVSGNLYLRSFSIANTGGTFDQVISIYDTCTSSNAASLAMTVVVPSSTTYNSPELLPKIFRLTSPCFKKSSTSSTVYGTFFYE